MRNGIIPRFNQWRREPGSKLVSQHTQPAIPLEYYLQLINNYYDSWKKYSLPMPRRECVHPERRIGSGHGTYDDTLLLNELPDYEAAWDPGYNEGLRGAEKRGRAFPVQRISFLTNAERYVKLRIM